MLSVASCIKPIVERPSGRFGLVARLLVEPRHAAVIGMFDSLMVVRAAPHRLAKMVRLFVSLRPIDECRHQASLAGPRGGRDPDLERHGGNLTAGQMACHRPFAVFEG